MSIRPILGFLFLIGVTFPLVGGERLGLVINEDNSHFYTSRTAEEMSLEGLHALVDQYAETEVSHLFFSPNSMKTSFASYAREAIWELGDQAPPATANGRRWVANARKLHEQGLDPYAVWIARCREVGISPWLSMRMNDVHNVPDVTSYMHDSFWRENPDLWRIPGDPPDDWTDRALDYHQPEVRKHAMALVRELLMRYQPDGLELDWMRFGWHFSPGEEVRGVEVLTEFMREVRALADRWAERRGRPFKIAVRVPAHPDAADGLGMPGVRWAQEGLIDMLVPCPFWTTSDYDIPLKLWRQRLGPAAAQVVLAPGIEYNMRAWPDGKNVPNTLETVRGWAAMAREQGADQLYFFNYMDSQTLPFSHDDYRIMLERGFGPAELARQSRRHPQTYRDTVPLGADAEIKLPAPLTAGAEFALNLGHIPSDATTTLILGLNSEAWGKGEPVVTVNGVRCPRIADNADVAPFPGTVRALRFACPGEYVIDGHNVFVVAPFDGADATQIVWAEARIEP